MEVLITLQNGVDEPSAEWPGETEIQFEKVWWFSGQETEFQRGSLVLNHWADSLGLDRPEV